MCSFLFSFISLSATFTSGEIAVVSAVSPTERRVGIVEIETGNLRDIGAGPWDGAPVWSPDGRWIAHELMVSSDHSGIRVVGADGTELRHLAFDGVSCRWPAWSPDGSRLAFAAGSGGKWRLWIHDLAANANAAWGTEELSVLMGRWSTDTELVGVAAVESEKRNTTNLYTIEENSVSSLVTTWGGGVYVEWMPAPHPATGAVAYESNDGGDREIFVERPRRGVIDVSNHRAPDWNPVWSPDGSWLAFESLRGGTRGIYKVAAMRTAVHVLASDASFDNWSPTWSPDGHRLAFVSTRDGKPGVYVCDAEGRSAQAVSPKDREDLAPAWRPVKVK